MTNEEITYYKNLKLEVNPLKDLLQNKAINVTIKTKISETQSGGVIEAYTGFGKSFVIKKLCERYRVKNNGLITILVPSQYLEKMIKEDIEHIDNVKVFVINTYTMYLDEIHETDFLICDEVHHILNNDSKYFSTALEKTKFKYFVGFSAFLEAKHKNFLLSHGINITFSIDLIDGLNLDIVPKFKIYNLGIDFTSQEKEQYIKWEKIQNINAQPFNEFQVISKINGYEIALFIASKEDKFNVKSWLINRVLNEENDIEREYYNIPKHDLCDLICKCLTLDIKPLDLVKAAFMYTKAVREKNNIIKHSQNKLILAKKYVESNQIKSIIFSPNSIVICDAIAKFGVNSTTIAYHSKINTGKRKKIIEAFNQNLFRNLVVIQALDEGFSIDDVKRGLILDIVGVTLRNIQRLGRLLRVDLNDLDKMAEMIYVYHKSFEYYDDEIKDMIEIIPADLKRLERAQKEFISIENISKLEDVL